jgi:DNA mismatch repair protein MSH6
MLSDTIGDKDYDPSSLYIPPAEFNKLSPVQKQFWEVKRNHFDFVIFFQQGSFYNVFDIDAGNQ